jgi:hypothetical protein
MSLDWNSFPRRLEALSDMRRNQLRIEMFDSFACKEIKGELRKVKEDLLELLEAFE